MPRVPFLPSVSTNALPTPQAARPVAGQFGEGIGQALKGVGQDVEAAGGQIAAIQEAERQKADVVSVTNMETQLTAGATDELQGTSLPGKEPTTGFLGLRGMDAAGQSAQTGSNIEQLRQKISGTAPNQRVRELFLARSGAIVENAHRQIQGHVGQQIRVAQQDSIDDSMQKAGAGLALQYADAPARKTFIASAEGPIRALYGAGEHGNAKVAQWHQQAAGTVMEAFLAPAKPGGPPPDVEGAKKFFYGPIDGAGGPTGREALGVHAAKYEAALNALGLEQRVDALAEKFVGAATDPETGKVDPAKAKAQLDWAPKDLDRKSVDAALSRRLGDAADAWKERVLGSYEKAEATLSQTHRFSDVPVVEREWLFKNAPKQWTELKDRSDRYERDANLKRAGAAPKATGEEQNALLQLHSELVTDGEKYADMTVPEFKALWQNKLFPGDYERAGLAFVAAKKDGSAGRDFNAMVRQDIGSSAKLAGKDNKPLADYYAATMGKERMDFKAKEKREPNTLEAKQMRDRVWQDIATDTWWGGTKHQPKFIVDFKADGKNRVSPYVEDGNEKGYVAPGKPAGSAQDRARELQKANYGVSDITRILKEEGFTK